MKTLMLLRHAEAIPINWNLSDRDRTLSDKGTAEAKKLGRYLATEKIEIDLLVSSPAARALGTTQALDNTPGKCIRHIEVVESLYMASAETLVRVIQKINDDLHTLLIVGHNPGIADLAISLSREPIQMKTCTLFTLQFPVKSWCDIVQATPQKTSIKN